MSRGRAYTRHQAQRWKSRVRRYHNLQFLWDSPDRYPNMSRWIYSQEDIEKEIGMYATTRKMCSCMGCGNPRRLHKEQTFKESVADLNFIEQLEEEGYRGFKKSRHIRFGQYYS